MYDAVGSQDEPEVRRLLDSDHTIDIDAVGGTYGTALGMAVKRRQEAIVTLLLDRGAGVNTVGGTYGTALGVAAYREDEEFITMLLDRGADINAVYDAYGTTLGIAVCQGNEKIITLLLDRGADVNMVGGTHGTALGMAVYWKRKEVITMLLGHGAVINSVGGTYGTALGVAVRWGIEEAVGLLLDRGADINTVGGRYGTALGVAAYKGDVSFVTLLLNRGADVNTVGGSYGTALGVAVKRTHEQIVALLLNRGADINTVGGTYGTALGVAVRFGDEETVNFLLDRGADVNTESCTQYGTALGVAASRGNEEMVNLLLNRGADVNTLSCTEYGTALGLATSQGFAGVVTLLLDRGADVNTVCGKYGTPLGIALYQGDEEMVTLLLDRGADFIYVGGSYDTAQGEYPTALDAARSGGIGPDLLALVTDVVEKELERAMGKNMSMGHGRNDEATNRPPFPMPYMQSYTGLSVYHRHLQAEAPLPGGLHSDTDFHAGDAITPEQANFPCEELNEELLSRLLIALVGIDMNKAEDSRAEGVKGWIRNDIRYFVSQKFDFGLAYAAARVGWKYFNEKVEISVQRARWLKKAKELDEARTEAIYTHSSGQELIRSPYSIMPRRIWDLTGNRVVEYRMLHAEMQSIDVVNNNQTMNNDPHSQSQPVSPESPLYPTFWAVTHSWTGDMERLAETSINQYQWPIPLPKGVDLERDVRAELLNFGAEYVWLDVLCLRQHSDTQKPSDHSTGALDSTKQNEWKIDVPTIGNIYRAAERVVRYFNGLGKPFSEHGWDDSRHWLRRAWTLQEISTESMTFNGGLGMSRDDKRIILNTKGKVGGKTTTLRAAIRPILNLAASLGDRGGCSMYDLTREMSRRCASQPTDKVAGLFYLLHTTELPTYDELISDEEAWRKCFHVLPFRRKIEILCDFPYRGPDHWYPSWKQLMAWPERDETYEHAAAESQQSDDSATPELIPGPDAIHVEGTESFFVDKIWAISHVLLRADTSNPNEYEVRIGGKVFGFYCPYRSQESIETENRQFTLAIPSPKHSYTGNWVVCEQLPGSRKRKFGSTDEKDDGIDVVEVKKVGVLRTDSCSELLVGKRYGSSMLRMINCMFV